MRPASWLKSVLSVLVALVLGAATFVGLRRRGASSRADPQTGIETPRLTPRRATGTSIVSILGTSGIVAIVALLGTLVTVIVGNFNLREQLASDRSVRPTEQAAARTLQEDQQDADRARRAEPPHHA